MLIWKTPPEGERPAGFEVCLMPDSYVALRQTLGLQVTELLRPEHLRALCEQVHDVERRTDAVSSGTDEWYDPRRSRVAFALRIIGPQATSIYELARNAPADSDILSALKANRNRLTPLIAQAILEPPAA